MATAASLVGTGRPVQGGCGSAGMFVSGGVLALPILLVVALLSRRRRPRG